MVFVKGGTFTMGVDTAQTGLAYYAESPAHQVTLSDFNIGKYEVTYYQFKQFVDNTGYVTDAEKNVVMAGSWCNMDNKDSLFSQACWRYRFDGTLCDSTDFDKPVVHVTLNDAREFCFWISSVEGQTYRLPTEAEWEYAAKGGALSEGYIYSGSDNLEEVGWFSGNANDGPHQVGTKLPNELGLYDMSGNVWEWNDDFTLYYSPEHQINPVTKQTEALDKAPGRGGSWSRFKSYCRVVNRTFYKYYNRGGGLGFRVVSEPSV